MIRVAPQIGQLSNIQFTSELDKLGNKVNAVKSHPARNITTSRCRCGGGRTIAPGRKFVSQSHYNVWLSKERYFERNARRGGV